MKKTLLAGAAALTLLATPAAAQGTTCVTDPTTGLLVGTVVGAGTAVALHNGYIVSASTTGFTGLGAAAAGAVAGIGTIALYDMFTSPCRGFGIMFRQQPVAVVR